MNRHRIFIAINLPNGVKKNLARYKERWSEIPAKWVKEENIHLTLEFLGYVSDQEVLDIINMTREAVSKCSQFFITLNKVSYGPDNKIPPKMIWVSGEISEELNSLKQELDKALGVMETRKFTPHITLARVKKWDWQRIEPDEREDIDKDISINFDVNSVEIMESVLKKGGPEYTVLESIKL